MKIRTGIAVIALCTVATAAASQAPAGPPLPGDPPAGASAQAVVQHGDKAYQYYCAPCHGAGKGSGRPMLPGTEALTVKYRGERPGLLEQRTDLTPEYVRFIGRNGIEGMPSFRKVELSDANLDAIGAYLSRNAAAQ